MSRLSIVTSLIALLLSSVAAPLSYAAPKACASDVNVVTIAISSVDPKTDKELWMIGAIVDAGSGTIKPIDAPAVTVTDSDNSYILSCKDTGDTDNNVHIYGCAFSAEDKAKTSAETLDVKFTATIGGKSCLYTGEIDFAEPIVIAPDQLANIDPDKALEECFDTFGFAGIFVCPIVVAITSLAITLHDVSYNIDGDDIPAFKDKCPYASGEESCTATDLDGDGVDDDEDNCTPIANPQQEDIDEDGLGDVCDPDRDGDKDQNTDDNCPNVANANQKDSDGDGLGDACDDGTTFISCENDLMICTTVPGTYCDPTLKQCLPFADKDGDGIPDVVDECPNNGTELDPCGTALPATVFAPPPPGPATGSADGGGGCSLQTSAPEHSTGVYLLLSFIAVMSALGIVKTVNHEAGKDNPNKECI